MPDHRPRAEIAIVRARYSPYGGAERFVQRALAALADRDVSLTVIARRWPREREGGLAGARDAAAHRTSHETSHGTAPSASDALPIAFERVDPFYVGSVWRDASFAAGVHRLLAHRRFDLVQSHERIPGLPVYRAGDGVHAEFLAQRHRAWPGWRRALPEANPYHAWMLRTERAMFEHPALRAVIVNSLMVRDEILAHFRIDARRLHLVRNGIDLARYAPPDAPTRAAARARFGLTAQRPAIAFVGSGFERKGLASAIEALAHPGAPEDAMLLVAGHDKHAAHYRRIAQQWDVADRLQLLGAVDDVRPVLHAADVMVLPALYDPFPNAVIEALACGVPVVTSTKSGAAEAIREGENGAVVDALDVHAIAEALSRLADPASAAARRDAARRSALDYSLETLGERLVALYREWLAS